MRKITHTLLLLALCLSVASCSKDEDDTINFIGDSIIEIWDLHRSFPTLITHNYGKSSSGIRHVENYAGRFHESTAVVMTGTNDLYSIVKAAAELNSRETEISNYVNRYELAVEALDASKVYIISILPRGRDANTDPDFSNSYIREINLCLKQSAQLHGWKFIDAYTPLSDSEGIMLDEYTHDGVHPCDAGYEVLTRLLQQHLL